MKCGHKNTVSVRLDKTTKFEQDFVWLHLCRECRQVEIYVDDFNVCKTADDGIVITEGKK